MKQGDDRQIHLIYASRNEEEAIFLDELKERASVLSNFFFSTLYSDQGEFARVDVMKAKMPESLESYDYFVCGPKPMVDGFVKDLKREGVQRIQIHTEAFEFR